MIVNKEIEYLRPEGKNKAYKVEKNLLYDITLATPKGLPLKDIEKEVIFPILEKMRPIERALTIVKTVLDAVRAHIDDFKPLE